MREIELERCPVCGSEDAALLGRVLLPVKFNLPAQNIASSELFPSGRTLLECSRCRLRRFASVLDPLAIVGLYQSEKVKDKWGGAKRIAAQVNTIIRLLPEAESSNGLKVLDIGCHTGKFLRSLPRVWSKTGVEINPVAADVAHQLSPESRILNRRFEDSELEDGAFSAITAWDVMEHVIDLSTLLDKVKGLLTPGGVLCFETGDYSSAFAELAGMAWYYYAVPDHTIFLSRQVVESMLRNHGLTLKAIAAGPHSRHADLSQSERLEARAKALATVCYTLRGNWKWPHHALASLLHKYGTLGNPYFCDHISVVAEKLRG